MFIMYCFSDLWNPILRCDWPVYERYRGGHPRDLVTAGMRDGSHK